MSTKKRDTRDRSEYQRKRREMFPELFRERHRAWRKKNPEKHAANGEKWRQKNKAWYNEYWRKWRTKNKEKLAAQQKARYAADLEGSRKKSREFSKKYYAANRDKWVEYGRRKRGLPLATRPEPSFCECCGKPPGEKIFKRLHLDHCHETGKFRGWLCSRCNRCIGALGDNLAGIDRARAYLLRGMES